MGSVLYTWVLLVIFSELSKKSQNGCGRWAPQPHLYHAVILAVEGSRIVWGDTETHGGDTEVQRGENRNVQNDLLKDGK